MAYYKKHKLTPSKDDASGGGGTRYETDPADMAKCDWLCKDSHNQSTSVRIPGLCWIWLV